MKVKSGGPAFPVNIDIQKFNGNVFNEEIEFVDIDNLSGMTLLDYLAAKAIHAMIPHLSSLKKHTIDSACETAYNIAEAMVEEKLKREKENKE